MSESELPGVVATSQESELELVLAASSTTPGGLLQFDPTRGGQK